MFLYKFCSFYFPRNVWVNWRTVTTKIGSFRGKGPKARGTDNVLRRRASSWGATRATNTEAWTCKQSKQERHEMLQKSRLITRACCMSPVVRDIGARLLCGRGLTHLTTPCRAHHPAHGRQILQHKGALCTWKTDNGHTHVPTDEHSRSM